MENRPLDQLMQKQMKEENHPHFWTNCLLFFYLVVHIRNIETHLFSIYILFVGCVLVNLCLTLSPFLSGIIYPNPTQHRFSPVSNL